MSHPLRHAACVLSFTLLLASGAQAEPPAVQGLIGSPRATPLVFQEDIPGFETRELDGGALLRLAPGTEIQRLRKTRLWLSGGKKTPTHVYRVTKGRVDVTIPPDKTHQVAVLLVGPKGNSGVMHQGRSMVVAKNDAVSFAALDAPMLTGKGSSWTRLAPGERRVVDLKRGGTAESPELKAPRAGVRQALTVALPGQGFRTQVKLTPVQGAERYQVVLLRENGNELEHVQQVESTSPVVTLSGQQPGRYSVVARALDRFGVPGRISSPESLRVIGVDLPPGARAKGGAVYLPPNRRVPLVAAEGLLMAYGTGKHFVKAPNSVAMSRGAATRVRFIDPKSKEEVSLNLLPHLVRASVEVGPKTARWPTDQVVIRVQLVDYLGEPIASTGELETRVTVNLNPVQVEFKRKGSKLEGLLPPPTDSKGPWVVRVEVMREGAGLIGRDFLEVVEAGAK